MSGGPALAGRVIPSAKSRSEASAVPPELLESAREALAKGDRSAQSAPHATPVRPPVDPGIDPAPQPPAFVHGELLVKLRGALGDALAGLRDALPDYRFEAGAWAAPEILTLRFHRAEAPAEPVGAEETRAVQARVAALDLFAYAELNYIRRAHAKPNDEHYEFAWHYPQIHMEAARELSTGSDQVVIAVIDDGVAPHEDLSRLLPGYDFVSDPMAAGDGDGRDPDPSPVGAAMQPVFHGQHVAGTIGADADNGKGIPGMDWRARVLPVRVLGPQGGTSADVIAGIHWAVGAEVPGAPANPNPAQVLNLSLGGGPLVAAEQEAIDAARAAGAILVVAAGNENVDASRQSLAGYEGVIVVGAVDYMGDRAFYSNFGPVVDVMAPGGDTSADKNADGYEDGVLSLWFDGGDPPTSSCRGPPWPRRTWPASSA